MYPIKIGSYSRKYINPIAKLSIPLHKAGRFNDGGNIQSIISLKEKTTPFPTSATFKRYKKHTCVDVTKMYKDTLSMRMNVGRNGTSYLQRNVTYVSYSHIKYENECREEWD